MHKINWTYFDLKILYHQKRRKILRFAFFCSLFTFLFIGLQGAKYQAKGTCKDLNPKEMTAFFENIVKDLGLQVQFHKCSVFSRVSAQIRDSVCAQLGIPLKDPDCFRLAEVKYQGKRPKKFHVQFDSQTEFTVQNAKKETICQAKIQEIVHMGGVSFCIKSPPQHLKIGKSYCFTVFPLGKTLADLQKSIYLKKNGELTFVHRDRFFAKRLIKQLTLAYQKFLEEQTLSQIQYLTKWKTNLENQLLSDSSKNIRNLTEEERHTSKQLDLMWNQIQLEKERIKQSFLQSTAQEKDLASHDRFFLLRQILEVGKETLQSITVKNPMLQHIMILPLPPSLNLSLQLLHLKQDLLGQKIDHLRGDVRTFVLREISFLEDQMQTKKNILEKLQQIQNQIRLKTHLNQNMMDGMARLLETKYLEPKLLEKIYLPKSPHLFLGTVFFGVIGYLTALVYFLIGGLQKGLSLSYQTLRRMGKKVCCSISKQVETKKLPEIPLSDLEALRQCILFAHEGKEDKGKVLALVEGQQIKYSSIFSSLLSLESGKVLLIDCSFNSSRPHLGLWHFLKGEIKNCPIEKRITYDFLSSGKSTQFAVELLKRPLFTKWIRDMQLYYDFILLMTRAKAKSVQAKVLLSFADAAILTLDGETHEDLEEYFRWEKNHHLAFLPSRKG